MPLKGRQAALICYACSVYFAPSAISFIFICISILLVITQNFMFSTGILIKSITHFIGIHPMALVKFDELKDKKAKRKIAGLTYQYANKERYFIDKLAEGIATIAAAFYPKEVLVRM